MDISKRIILFFLLALPVFAQAQLKSDFVGICGFEGFSNTSGSNYRGDIVNFIDRYNLGVTTKNILAGDEIIDGSGDVFEVTTVHSTASNFEADITVVAKDAGSGAPSGTGQVYRPTTNGVIPTGSVDNLGLSNVTKGLIDMHNALRLDSLIGANVGGDSIIAVEFALDTLRITMASDTVFNAVIPIDSLQQVQADSIAALYDSLGVKVDTIIAGNNISVTYAAGRYTISAPNPDVGTDDQTAGEVWYNDSYLPLNVNDVQQAIDSLKRDLDAVSSGASDGVATAGALDVGNEEIDVTVAAPGTGFSIDISVIETLSSFSGWDMDASDDFSGAWGDLTGVPAGFADNVDDVDDADASATNEGSLTVGAGTASTALINSNTSGSAGVTIEANTGIGVTENVGTGTIFIENTGDLDATNELDLIGFTGDAGSAQQIGDGEFLDLEGGYGVVTTMSTDKANFKVDTSEVATVWALGDSISNISTGTGWLKDSLAAGDVDIAMNRNQLSFSSNIPFGASSDTLISLSTPRSDAGLNPHYLVFNFGNNSAGFVEDDTNLSFFNTVPGEGLGYAGDYFNATATSSLKDRQIPDIQTVKRLISDSVGTSINIYNTSDTVTTDRKVIAQDENTYLDFIHFDYLNINNDDGIDNMGLRIVGDATASYDNELLVLSDGKGADSVTFFRSYEGGAGGFRIESTDQLFVEGTSLQLISGSNSLNLVNGLVTDANNTRGLSYAADYSANFIDESLVTKRYVDAQTGGGSAFWENSSGTVRTVSASSGLDFVFGSSQLDDSGTSAEDHRFFFDNSKGAFYAGEWTSTEADDANRGFNSVNLTRNAITSAYTSASIGGEGNDIDGSGSVAVACDDCIADGSSSNSVLTGKDARSTLENDYVHGGGGDLNLGHHQYRRLVAWKDHTGTGIAVLHLNGTNADLVIPNNTVWAGQCECSAIVKTGGTGTSVGDHKFYQGRFAAKNIAGSTSVQFINTTDSLLDSPSFGSSSLSLLADDTNDALTILINSVPGSGTSITHITCTLHITETGY